MVNGVSWGRTYLNADAAACAVSGVDDWSLLCVDTDHTINRTLVYAQSAWLTTPGKAGDGVHSRCCHCQR